MSKGSYKMKNNIFTPADIMLPYFVHDVDKMNKWAVIACDQFTSEEDYWDRCKSIVGDSPSALNFILPEVYLGSVKEESQIENIRRHVESFESSMMLHIDGMIYLERTLPNGMLRRGIIGKIDLEKYSYDIGSHSPIRATEATIVERIPSRGKIRAFSKIELPHILILVDDNSGLFDTAAKNKTSDNSVYDFDLMLGGGHAAGYKITDDALDELTAKISEYESSHENGVVYAMGDGNHSLAAAKAHWEKLKSNGADMNHPARYALCELTPLSDESLVFEPIYRLLKNCDVEKFMSEFTSAATESGEGQRVTVVTGNSEKTYGFNEITHPLTVGTLQNFIDGYIKANPDTVCDYIHGENSLRKLASEDNTIGFLFDGMDKSTLFDYVEKNGTLPRKTFSMGEAESKRYYLESRLIV